MTDHEPEDDDGTERVPPPGDADTDSEREATDQVAQDPDAPGLGAADKTDDLGDAPEPNEPA